MRPRARGLSATSTPHPVRGSVDVAVDVALVEPDVEEGSGRPAEIGGRDACVALRQVAFDPRVKTIEHSAGSRPAAGVGFDDPYRRRMPVHRGQRGPFLVGIGPEATQQDDTISGGGATAEVENVWKESKHQDAIARSGAGAQIFNGAADSTLSRNPIERWRHACQTVPESRRFLVPSLLIEQGQNGRSPSWQQT